MRVVGEEVKVLSDQQISNKISSIETKCQIPEVKFLISDKVKISELMISDSFYDLLGVLFTKIANLSGLKGEISDINKIDISDLILDFHKNLSLEEIYYAFKLERYNRYETKTKHYEMFGAEYVSEVLKKYVVWKKNKIKESNLNLPVLPQQIELKEEDKKQIVESGAVRMFEDFKKTREVPVGCVYVYDYLRKEGYIKSPSKEYVEKIKKKATINIKVVNRNKKAHSLFSSVFSNSNTETQIQNECKRLFLIDYFKEKESENS